MSLTKRMFRLSPNSKRVYKFEAEGGGEQGETGETGLGVLNYSESEQITGFLWTDNRPVFVKVLPFAVGPKGGLGAPTVIPHGITGDFTILTMNGIIFTSDKAEQRPLPLVNVFNVGPIQVEKSIGDIILTTDDNSNYSDWSGHVIIQYVKP